MKILVTGSAGFIGFHASRRLLEGGHEVIGLDNINDYYDIKLKRDRLKILKEYDLFSFYENNLEDKEAADHILKKNLGMEANLNLMPMQGGDVRKSNADVTGMINDFDYTLKWNIQDGVKNFIQWYVEYYKVSLSTR